MSRMPSAARVLRPPKVRRPAMPSNVADLLARLGVSADRVLLSPPPGTATVRDLVAAARGPEGRPCELLYGTLVEKPAMTEEGILTAWLTGELHTYLKRTKLGPQAGGDCPFELPDGTVRLPDVSFVAWEEVPTAAGRAKAVWRATPAFVVEVLSRSNTAKEVAAKLGDYFRAGCRIVWVINPPKKSARVYTAETEFTEYGRGDVLDGGDVLPGFTVVLDDLFAAATPPRELKKK